MDNPSGANSLLREFKTGFPRFLLVGYFGFGNLGDDCILEAWKRRLCDVFSGSRLAVVGPACISFKKDRDGLIWLPRFSWGGILRYMLASQGVIFPGGGLWQDVSSSGSFYYYLSLLVMAFLLRKKTILWAQGIGPLRSGLHRKLARFFTGRADIVSVRDAPGAEWFGKSGRHVFYVPDPAVSFQPVGKPRPAGRNPRVGLALSLNCHPDPKMQGLISALEKAGCRVVRIFCRDAPEDGMEPEESAPIWRGSPESFLCNLSSLDLVVSSRLHPLIFSAVCSIPAVGLDWDPKIRAWQEQVGMPTVKLQAGEDLRLAEIILALLHEKERITQLLKERVDTLRRLEESEFQALLGRIRAMFS
ncbi:MAG: polysaccharide pyruvyl transferase family protein [Bacillota bacterium]